MKQDSDLPRELMTVYLVSHYKRLHGVIDCKLGHARAATQAAMRQDGAATAQSLPGDLNTLDTVWDEIIALFRRSGLGTGDLERIESVLSVIPATIRAHYDTLVKADPALCADLAHLAGEEYKSAYRQAVALAEKMGMPVDFALDENDRMIAPRNNEKLRAAAEKAYIIFRDKGKKR